MSVGEGEGEREEGGGVERESSVPRTGAWSFRAGRSPPSPPRWRPAAAPADGGRAGPGEGSSIQSHSLTHSIPHALTHSITHALNQSINHEGCRPGEGCLIMFPLFGAAQLINYVINSLIITVSPNYGANP